MGNSTKVTDLTIGGVLGMIVVWLLSYFLPDLMATAPEMLSPGLALLITAAFTYFKPSES